MSAVRQSRAIRTKRAHVRVGRSGFGIRLWDFHAFVGWTAGVSFTRGSFAAGLRIGPLAFLFDTVLYRERLGKRWDT